ncbi:glycosyltransferase [Streptomyces hainanensis]|uniref:Glycosyltransferase n=1 Tax=Streptomyces hainanensis TaxID=402648 RepID=A0A4R4TR44_9ACTN|nr:glycosyltransferase family 2 protein [Streptomyces hainanensis]TDC79226.1 glycosyltransferase [Streptomyces hainanensis]
MSALTPNDPQILAQAVVTTMTVDADPQAREASIAFWDRGTAYRLEVLEAAEKVADDTIRRLLAELRADPTDARPQWELTDRLRDLAAHRSPEVEELFALAWQAESNSRLGYHLGRRYGGPSTPKVEVDELRALQAGDSLPLAVDAPVLVVVPFRDRGPGLRLRNLLACLLSLRDQSAPRFSYRVVVVESDDVPRWRDVVLPYVDHYVFAPKDGAFNKSWAVNAGVVNTPGRPEVICILDADVLADRDFVSRNTARFRHPGTMGHLTYRDMWCLDPSSTCWAIRERVRLQSPEADSDHLRAFVLRRPPGCCVWARTSAFHRIEGMDERFEGWGGEDNDFAYRMDYYSAFDHYDDLLLHMYHPSSAVLREDGDTVNAHIPVLSWRPTAPIGDLTRFTDVAKPEEPIPTDAA